MPHPDYDRIAQLEREIYDRTFEHLGASAPQNRALTFITPLVNAHLRTVEDGTGTGIGYMNIEQRVALAKALDDAAG